MGKSGAGEAEEDDRGCSLPASARAPASVSGLMTMRNPGHCSQSRTYPPLAHRAATVRGTWLRGQGADKSGCGYNGTLRKLRWACPLDFGAKTYRQMDQFYIRPLTEADLTGMVEAAGGIVAHLNADRRSRRSSDFILRGAVIELKILNEDGFAKTERQQRLASLFRDEGIRAAVVVLDRENLSSPGRRAYDRIIEGPIKTEIASARKQLKETRKERSDTTLSMLLVVNNGYTALNHDDLVRLVGHRARNDSQRIDGVIVGGCYFHSDGGVARLVENWRTGVSS